MFKRLLVPLDGSVQSSLATQTALELASRSGAALTGLYVIDSKILEAPYLADLSGISGVVPFTGLMAQVRESLEKHGDHILESFQRICNQRGIQGKAVVETGSIHKIIARFSMSHDLIVMGRRSNTAEWVGHLLGSTVENTLRLVRIPVLLAGDTFQRLGRVLIAYDGSHAANAALRVAIHLFETERLDVTLLAVATHADMASPLLSTARELLGAHGITFSEMLRAGDPREQIVLAAKESVADLIVMGAFGHSRLRELLLGSTTAYVMRSCPLPVLVARWGKR